MPRRGRTAWDRWTAAGAPWPSRSPSPTRTTDDDALEEAWAAHGMAQPGPPSRRWHGPRRAVLRPCRHQGARHRASNGRAFRAGAAVAARTGRYRLADDLMAEAQGGADQRAAPVPGVEQQARGRRPRAVGPWPGR